MPIVPTRPFAGRVFSRCSPDFLKKRRHGQTRTPALVGLALCVVLLVLFAMAANLATEGGGRNDFDDGVALRVREVSATWPWLRGMMVIITFLGGVPFLSGVVTIGTVWLYRAGRPDLALAWFLIAIGGGLLDMGLKLHYDRDRPPPEWRDR